MPRVSRKTFSNPFARSPHASATLARTAWATVAELGRLVSASVLFVIAARALGPSGFGQYAGTLALASMLVAFASFGGGNVIVMRVVREQKDLGRVLSESLTACLVGSAAITILLLVGRTVLLEAVPWHVFVTLVASELLFAGLVEVAIGASQAKNDLRNAALSRSVLGFARLGCLSMGIALGSRSLGEISLAYLVGSAIGGSVSLALTCRRYGLSLALARPSERFFRDGLHFALGLSAFGMQDSIDKTLLVRAGLHREAGIYAAGYRIASLMLLPLSAFLRATYTQFFEKGAGGLGAAWGYGRRLLKVALGYGIVAAAMLYGAASFLPVLFGSEYLPATSVVRYLAFLPLLRALQYLPGNALTGAGYHRARSSVQALAAVANVGLNLVLIPQLGWRGAALATIFAELLSASGLWLVLVFILRREAPGSSPQPFPSFVGRRAAPVSS